MNVDFTDSLGIHRSQIVTTDKISQKDESAPLFDGQYGNHYRSFGASFSGYIVGANGQKISVVVNYNMGNLLSIVDLAGGGVKQPLLIAE